MMSIRPAVNFALTTLDASQIFCSNLGDSRAVMASEGWKKHVDRDLMNEVLAHMAGVTTTASGGKKRKASAEDEEVEEVKRMKVAQLREELQRRNLDFNGRKGELVERLESAMGAVGKEAGSSSSGGSSSSSSSSSHSSTAQ